MSKADTAVLLDELTEERLRTLIDQVPLMLVAVDFDGVITQAQGKGLSYAGADPTAMVGRPVGDVYRRFPDVGAHFARALGGERFDEVIEDFRVSYEVYFSPLYDDQGGVRGAVGLATDVTHRRSAERVLAYKLAAEELVGDISTSFINLGDRDPGGLIGLAVETLGDFVEVDRCFLMQLSPERDRLDCTHEWCAPGIEPTAEYRAGLLVEELPWMMERLTALRILHVQRVSELPDAARAEKALWQSLGIRSLLLVPLIYRGRLLGSLGYDIVRGNRYWSDDELALQRNVATIFVNALARMRLEADNRRLHEQLEARVAERTAELRYANEALKDSEEKYRLLYEATSDAVLLLAGSRVVDCNGAALDMLACEVDAELIGKPLGRFFSPVQPDGKDSVATAEAFAESSRREGAVRFEWWFRRRDGSEFPADVMLESLDWSGEELLQVVVRDITQRKGEEEALRISEERFRGLIEYGTDLILVLNDDATIRYESPSIGRILGYDQAALDGRTIYDYIHPDDVEQARQACHRCLSAPSRLVTVEYRFRHRDDTWRTLEMVGQNQLHEPGIEGLVLNCRDITERKRVEAEIARAQTHALETEKMAALGSLVAGVAHEINTPIGVGVTAASYLARKTEDYRRRYRDGELTRTDFEAFMKAAVDSSTMLLSNLRRAAELIRSFQQVAVDQSHDTPRRIRLADYLSEVLRSLGPKLKKGQHRVDIHCPAELEITTYPGALAQIVTNLVMNSLLHGFEDRSEGEIRVDGSVEASTLILRYADDGCGIERGHLRKIWEPFFSTKRGRGGSGLGLHIVYNLVTQTLGGLIECASELGAGTSFTMRIPLVQGGFDGRPA